MSERRSLMYEGGGNEPGPLPEKGYGARLDEVLAKSGVLQAEIREMVEQANKLDMEKQKLLKALHEQVERRLKPTGSPGE